MRRLLEWLERGPRLESQIVGSGLSRTLDAALLAGYAEMGADPHVKGPAGVPAASVAITGIGLAAIKGEKQ